jgi:hypothetical protein
VGINIFFENEGSTPAQRFIVNGGVYNSGGIAPQHLNLARRSKRGGLWSSGLMGTTITSHETIPIRVYGVSEKQISDGLSDKTGFTMGGSFEFVNVFDEYWWCREVGGKVKKRQDPAS